MPENNTAEGTEVTTTASKGLTLTCMVTGKSRTTTKQYLDEKAAKLNITVAEVTANYICKDALKMLRAGKPLAEVQAALNAPVRDIDTAVLAAAISMNGKQKKATPAASVTEATV